MSRFYLTICTLHMHILLTEVIDRIHNMLDACMVHSQTTLPTPLVSLVGRCTFLHVKVPFKAPDKPLLGGICDPLVEISINIGAAASIRRSYPSVRPLSTFDKLGYQILIKHILRYPSLLLKKSRLSQDILG